MIPNLLNSGTIVSFFKETSITQPNAITATFQDSLMGDWRQAAGHWSGSRFSSGNQYQYADQRLSSVITSSLVVLPRCSLAQSVTAGQNQVTFPVKAWTSRTVNATDGGSFQWEINERPYNITILSRDLTNVVQHEWIDLPTDQFGPVSGGIVVHLPNNDSDTSYALVACSISAYWSSGEMKSDSLSHDAAWSFTGPIKKLGNSRKILDATSDEANRYFRLINIGEKWFQSLSPQISCVSRGNQSAEPTTTLGRLFSDVGLLTVLHAMRTLGYRPFSMTCVRWANPVGTGRHVTSSHQTPPRLIPIDTTVLTVAMAASTNYSK